MVKPKKRKLRAATRSIQETRRNKESVFSKEYRKARAECCRANEMEGRYM
jgi:hypothetical protein